MLNLRLKVIPIEEGTRGIKYQLKDLELQILALEIDLNIEKSSGDQRRLAVTLILVKIPEGSEKNGTIGNLRKNRDHRDYNIITIG